MGDRGGAATQRARGGTIADVAFELLAPLVGLRLLEVGTGTGLHLGGAITRGAVAWGVDPDAAVLRAARDESPEADLRLGAAPDLPFDSASFDVVCLFGDLGSGPSASARFADLVRVCRPGGRIALAGPAADPATGADRPGTAVIHPALIGARPQNGVVILER